MRLKYDDTHSDQKFSENGVWPLIVWKRPRDVHLTPTKRLRNAYERPPHCVETPPQFEETLTKHPNTEEEELTFSEFLVRIGNVIFQMHCILDENISDIISLDIISDIIS